jgi:hypothetical protein
MSQASQNEELLGDEPFLVLNAIYLRKLASPEHVGQATGLSAERSRAEIAALEAEGFVLDLGGQAMLTDDGRARVLAYYRDTYAAARASDAVAAWYGRFETVNAQFIKLVTEWQKSDGDERVQERLVRLVERHISSLRDIAKSVPRYETYVTRFENGLSKIDSGQRDYVCKPTLDSVHNIWFEFHEDILAVMGRPRET